MIAEEDTQEEHVAVGVTVGVTNENQPFNRWRNLIQPVKDMAAAWAVDVGAELEAYMAELEQIRFTYEDPTSLNFSEGVCPFFKKN
jgi:5,10-methenyltetrahydromethanopterin hydrogenase